MFLGPPHALGNAAYFLRTATFDRFGHTGTGTLNPAP